MIKYYTREDGENLIARLESGKDVSQYSPEGEKGYSESDLFDKYMYVGDFPYVATWESEEVTAGENPAYQQSFDKAIADDSFINLMVVSGNVSARTCTSLITFSPPRIHLWDNEDMRGKKPHHDFELEVVWRGAFSDAYTQQEWIEGGGREGCPSAFDQALECARERIQHALK